MTDIELTPLSGAETEILRLVWQSGSATVQKVCDSLPSARKIAYATVQTLLRRLEKKGYVKHKTVGKAHVFSPAVKQDDVISSAVGSFLDRLFGGDPIPLINYLARHGKISDSDIDRLKKTIVEDESELEGE
jgi:predicted transcriptional regulator